MTPPGLWIVDCQVYGMPYCFSFIHFFDGLHLNANIQLFRERLSEKMYTRQSRKVIWDMIDTLSLTTVAVEPTFVAFR